MHNDLLDTVLVSKDVALEGNKAGMKGPGSEAAAGAEEKCPVDHRTRELWMQQARAAQTTSEPSKANIAQPTPPHPVPQSLAATTTTAATEPSSWSSWFRLLPFTSSQTAAPAPPSPPPPSQPKKPSILDEARTVSSIPRSSVAGPAACPSNHEQETGASESGHWVYPSEKQFFEAMRRKGFTAANAADMKTVVPIHNAVNERAWAEILKWEEPYREESKACGGPRLFSFAGEKGNMTPKARINTILGYTAPFDRHDWVVDRCGTKVEYVIDFYSGRGGSDKLNFYLDVRPKLNSWEGVKMRFARATGLA
ncbi:putative cytochrome C1 heme lyase [Cladorrhinum samala]|uniref:Holocytochrome c-type synthase n=1 Tax=Cladorrhinum samala TaxID=585594 RepID=A0AAV9HNZ1_9PEZI|nr:putative cytochrome C1 heme lyase [Cladorrhinum samala]